LRFEPTAATRRRAALKQSAEDRIRIDSLALEGLPRLIVSSEVPVSPATLSAELNLLVSRDEHSREARPGQRSCFGTMRSVVRIQSPRPYKTSGFRAKRCSR